MNLTIRKATLLDGNLLFSWANDLVMRTMAVNSSFINYADHFSWFQYALKDPCSTIYIVYLSDQPVGQVRFNFNGFDVEIDIYIALQFRGAGLAASMLSRCIDMMCLNNTALRLNATVLLGNYPSYHLFSKCDFVFVGFFTEKNKMAIKLHRLLRM